MWVDIEGSGAAQAKDHIISLCHDLIRIEEKLPPGFGNLLAGKLDGIAAQTGTKIVRSDRVDTLVLSGGDETNLALACSMITEECNVLRRRQEFSQPLYVKDSPSESYPENETFGRLCVESLQQNSPKDRGCESEDSSLSRFHTVPSTRNTHGAQDNRPNAPDVHTDLNSESNTLEMGKTIEERRSPRLIAHSVALPETASVLPQDIVNASPLGVQPKDSRTISLINSMQKLGYPKDQVNLTLRQLGPNADHNDVLGALVNQRPAKMDLEEPREAGKEETIRGRDLSDGYSTVDGAEDESNNLRPIIIDGSNVAMSFGNKDVFACKGIEIVVNWFCERGHQKIYVFVPTWRKEASKPETPITDQGILTDLEKRSFLVWTPSRRINGRRVVCYDDRYILKTAVEEDGIIVSNDNFRDIQNERTEWRKVIEERLLLYSFVGDRFMPPDDPLGRHGPSLDNFLRMKPTMPDHLPQACPYGKKCTYGNKCKYYHADRPNRPMKSISETLKERDKNRKERAKMNSDRSNSPRFSSISSAPIPGYVPPEDVTTTPEWHTTPLPGPASHQPTVSQRKGGRIASESSGLQMSPGQSGSPRHLYATESAPQSPYSSPRDEVFGMPDLQQYQSAGVHQTHSQVAPQALNTSPLGRASHTAPLPNFSQHSERPGQRDMYTVPLQSYPSQNQPDRGYAQMDESLIRKRMSMPPVLFGSGEALGVTPSGINFERRTSHNDLMSDFQRMGIHHEQSGMPSPREPQPQPNYGYRQSPQQYHSGEQFPGQPLPNQRPGDANQGTSQPMAYHSGESFVPQPPINSTQMMYPPPIQTSPIHTPRSYYSNKGPVPTSGGWHGNARPTPDHPVKSLEEQRMNIMRHLSSRFGREQVEAVMQRHPHETNPRMLMMFMSTNT